MAAARTRGYGDRDSAAPPARSDAYTGLLAISLVAMITGCVLLLLDYQQYSKQKPGSPPAPMAVKPVSPGIAAPPAQ